MSQYVVQIRAVVEKPPQVSGMLFCFDRQTEVSDQCVFGYYTNNA